MSHLSFVVRILAAAITSFTLLGCTNKDNQTIAFRAIDYSLGESNTRLYADSEAKINQLSLDSISFQKAQQIRLTTKNLFDTIVFLKAALLREAGFKGDSPSFNEDQASLVATFFAREGSALYRQLQVFKNDLFLVDSVSTKDMQNSFRWLPYGGGVVFSEENFANKFFDGTSVVGAMALLTQLQNMALLIENSYFNHYVMQMKERIGSSHTDSR